MSTEIYKRFYRSVPSDLLISGARLVLQGRIHPGFVRIGILYSRDEVYAERALYFSNDFSQYYETIVLEGRQLRFSLTLGFDDDDDLEDRLMLLRDNTMNIIHGFFGPKDARKVLCKAKRYNLTTPSHLWILPAYFNPYWWKAPSGATPVSCTDEEMRGILESTIFVDGVKFPPFGSLSMSEFTTKVHQKTAELFPYLEDVDLEPLLLNSRAVNAYDAIMLVVNSVNSFSTESEPVDPCLIDCEWCRIYTPCFADAPISENCSVCSHDADVASLCSVGRPERDVTLEANAGLSYGQILFTQFVDGHHCPIVMWWATSNLTAVETTNYVSVSQLSNLTCGNNDMLKDIAGFLNHYTQRYNCPTDFVWKGDGPPSAFIIEPSGIHPAALIVVGILCCIGIMMAVMFCVSNVVFRNEKNVKASSPRLNILILTGYGLLLPVNLYTGIVLSTNLFPNASQRLMNTLCQLTIWSLGIGFSLIFSTILMKSWRLYWIFTRIGVKKEKSVTALTDSHLFAGIALLCSVTAVILTVYASNKEWRYQYLWFPEELSGSTSTTSQSLWSARNLNLTFCGTYEEYFLLFDSALLGYFVILIAMSFFFIFRNRRMHSNFKYDSQLSFRALIISLFPLIFDYVGVWVFRDNHLSYVLFWWIYVLGLVVCNIISQIVMFLPMLHTVYQNKKRKAKLEVQEQQYCMLRSQYSNAVMEEKLLREQLAEKEKAIEMLRKAKQLHSDDT